MDERDGYKGISLLYLSSVFWLDMNAKGYKKTLSVLNYSLENSKPIKVGLKKVNDKIEIVAAKKINTKYGEVIITYKQKSADRRFFIYPR